MISYYFNIFQNIINFKNFGACDVYNFIIITFLSKFYK